MHRSMPRSSEEVQSTVQESLPLQTALLLELVAAAAAAPPVISELLARLVSLLSQSVPWQAH